MNVILNMPIAVRLAVAFVLGACVGSLVNLAAYRLAWRTRAISPWLAADDRAPPRRAWDRVPILGWLGLRREAPLHGPGFWIRPMLVELGLGLGFAAIYWWETVAAGLLPAGFPPGGLVPFFLHCEVLAHLCVAFADAGGLADRRRRKDHPRRDHPAGHAAGPGAGDGHPLVAPAQRPDHEERVSRCRFPPLDLSKPLAAATGWLSQRLLALRRLGLLLGWCAAILPRTWYNRHGWRRAMRLSLASSSAAGDLRHWRDRRGRIGGDRRRLRMGGSHRTGADSSPPWSAWRAGPD